MMPPADIHTHRQDAVNAIINLERGQEQLRPDALYSVGWHPWWLGEPDWEWIERMAANPQVVQIGECGIDTKRGGLPIEGQIEVTRRHALLAEQTAKPLLLHIVGAWAEVIALRKELNPRQKWIIHGFRGKPELAAQLLRAGFDISLGAKYNPLSEAIIPAVRLYRETD